MPTLRPFRLATLTLGIAFCALTCGTKSNSIVDQVCPTSVERVMTDPAMTAMEFCQVYIQTCTGTNSPPGGYITEAECETAFSGLMFDSTRECRSYHLCNAASYDATHTALHCRHTVGLDLCADTGP